MADEKDLWKQIGLTPGKAALIGVLAVVLVGVLYMQYGPDGSEDVSEFEAPAVESPPPRPRQIAAPSNNAAPPAPAKAPAAEALSAPPPMLLSDRWTAPQVEKIVQYDPFALPPSFPQPARVETAEGLTSEGIIAADAATRASQLADAVAKLQTELETLRQRGVSVIVRQRDEYVAMIGDRMVHVGDEINGFTVTAIEPDGVRVEKKVTE